MATTKVIPGVLDLNATGADKSLKMPSGTTSNQPTGASGIIRNNTDESNGGSSSCMEYYNGSDWKVMINCTTNVLDILDDGSCIAAYTFDGNVNDLSGNYNGTATSITYSAGKYGQAADFNGSSSKVELPSALSDGSTTVANCISFWFILSSYWSTFWVTSRFTFRLFLLNFFGKRMWNIQTHRSFVWRLTFFWH